MVTFPSLEEGWGNQFLEGVRARLPVLVFEHPVYRADIKDCGFRVISLGYELEGRDEMNLARVPPYAVEAAADHAVELLTDSNRRQEAVARNFEIARQYFSLGALRGYLMEMVGE